MEWPITQSAQSPSPPSAPSASIINTSLPHTFAAGTATSLKLIPSRAAETYVVGEGLGVECSCAKADEAWASKVILLAVRGYVVLLVHQIERAAFWAGGCSLYA
ncbi:hypothetical protein Acr_17g0011640 [Actinidia rufa]|uniref:Uncharacterized protein n=1 Tax=Actinidia rufa TaxID=165716 RepID=A0A7J0G4C8_9ERIC|nr:hypothetical protein Acr_17g0011640 [Actinidia rufa]